MNNPEQKESKESPKMGEGGNTGNPPPPKISVNQCSHWCFTINNFDKKDIEILLTHIESKKYIFQHEKGESGTDHLQGYIHLKEPMRLTELKKFINCHWENTKSIKGSIAYCSDPLKREGKIWSKGIKIKESLKILDETSFYPWQKSLTSIIESEPNNRDIIWIYEEEGNVGKTAYAKWAWQELCACVFKAGISKSDLVNLLMKEAITECIILDIARSKSHIFDYSILEEIKDGFIQTGKYEGGTKMFNSPHVIIFSNEAPNIDKLSKDRWKIYKINEKLELIPEQVL